MSRLAKPLLIAVVVLLAIIVIGGNWAYKNFDETATTGWSSVARNWWYHYLDDREERILLAPVAKGADSEFVDKENLTHDWHTKKAPAWHVALEDFKGKPDLRYLEVGAYEGRSVMWMFTHVLTDPSSNATVIDIFYDMGVKGYSQDLRDRYDANIATVDATDRTETIVEFSQIALRDLPVDSYDIIYIDGSHFAPDVLEDAVLAQRLLKKGGVLIFDDYRWWVGAPKLGRPKAAVDTFVEFYNEQFEVLHNGLQVILRKYDEDAEAEGMVIAPDPA